MRGRAVSPAWVVFTGMVVMGLLVRWWLLRNGDPIRWPDSADYEAVARAPLTSLDFWAGERPWLMPLVLRGLGGNPDRLVVVQATVASLSWAALAASVADGLTRPVRRWLAVGVVAVISVSAQVQLWENTVLTESLALSALALLIAAGLQLIRRVDWFHIAVFALAMLAFVAVRDTHASVVLIGAAALGAWILLARPKEAGKLAVLATVALSVGAMASLAASHGERSATPLRHVMAIRILPFPERVRWFAGHGMPQSALFVEPEQRERWILPAEGALPERAMVWSPRTRDSLREWDRWLETEGDKTLLAWMATHPDYALVEPWRGPDRSFDVAAGSVRGYAGPGQADAAATLGPLPMPPAWSIALLAFGIAIWTVKSGRWRHHLVIVGGAAVMLAAPHAFVSWHANAVETTRHLLIATTQLQLGTLMLALGSLQAVRRDQDTTPAASAVRGSPIRCGAPRDASQPVGYSPLRRR